MANIVLGAVARLRQTKASSELFADARLETFLQQMGEMDHPRPQGEDVDGRATVMEFLTRGPRRTAVIVVVGDAKTMHVFTLNDRDQIYVDSLNGLYDDDRNYKCSIDGQQRVLKTIGLVDIDDFMDHYVGAHH